MKKQLLFIITLLLLSLALTTVLVACNGELPAEEQPTTAPTDAPITNLCAAGHTPSEWILDESPSKTTDGKRHRECSVCQETLDREILYATGSVGLAYTQIENTNTCEITGIGSCTDKELYIPHEIDGLLVTSIRIGAFSNNMTLEKVTLAEGISTVGNSAFMYCSNIQSISLPSSLVSIPKWMFYECTSLKEVTVPAGTQFVGEGAFQKCTALQTVTLSESALQLDTDAFRECSALETVSFPSTLTHIGSYAFYQCQKLAGISLPEGLTAIGDYAFSQCKRLQAIAIPKNVQTIGSYAFAGCTALGELVISDGVETIQDHAFYKCTALFDPIIIPKSVTLIGKEAFRSCNIKEVRILCDSAVIEDSAFFASNLETLIIGNGVTQIGTYAFAKSQKLKTVVIGSAVTHIEANAFHLCKELTAVYYAGTESQWSAITIGEYNGVFSNQTPRYYYKETQPTTQGNYWHYVNEIPTIW